MSQSKDMEKPIEGDPKAKAIADREKFESIEKVELTPLRVKSQPTKAKMPKLESPDEKNPKWVPDPEEALAARRARAKAAKRSKNEA